MDPAVYQNGVPREFLNLPPEMMPPMEGSPPGSINLDDVKRVTWQTLLVAVASAAGYLSQYGLPEIETADPTMLLLIPVVTAALQVLQKFLTDTREVPTGRWVAQMRQGRYNVQHLMAQALTATPVAAAPELNINGVRYQCSPLEFNPASCQHLEAGADMEVLRQNLKAKAKTETKE